MTQDSSDGRSGAQADIASQPDVWAAAIADLDRLAPPLPRLDSFSEVVFTGCGSTAYLAQWAAAHCRDLRGVPALALPASELVLNPGGWALGPEALLVAVSRSGRTTETVRAAREFRGRGLGKIVVVTCEPDGELAQWADWVLAVPSGAETTVPQTRSFTSMMLATARLLSGAPDTQLVDRLASEGRRLLTAHPGGLEPRPDNVAYTFLGTGPRSGLASESMLKVKEMSLLPAEAFQTLDFRHGPISTVGVHSVVVAFVPERAAELELAVLDDVADLGATTIAIGPSSAHDPSRHTRVEFAPDLAAPWRDVLYLPVVHRTALAAAHAQGLDPDNPTNLQAVVVLDE